MSFITRQHDLKQDLRLRMTGGLLILVINLLHLGHVSINAVLINRSPDLRSMRAQLPFPNKLHMSIILDEEH